MTKKVKFTYLLLFIPFFINAQTTPVAGDYKIIDIGNNGAGDYTRNLILIHEIYNGTMLEMNNAVGTITAFRGNSAAGNRINVVEVKSSSSYNSATASINSINNYGNWVLKTCIYNGKKYLAVDVPYSPAFHNWGYKFAGWTKSTGENMKSVNYEVNGLPVNTSILSNIQDFVSNMDETHQVNNFLIMGNVGIGTESIGSQTKLHVKESGSSDNVWRGRIVASGDLNAIVMGEYGGKAWLGAHNSQLNAWSNLIIQGGGGNVGIGMTNPLNKLDVNGTIHSKEVKVDMTGWSDFVFKKEYELPTLAEVEKHIAEKGHLENIPSEEEVLKNGINLGEMNAKLLQKIEELTLYSIDQNKKIETQAKEIESLKDLVLRVTKIESELARK